MKKNEFKLRKDAVSYLRKHGWNLFYYHRSGAVTASHPTNRIGKDIHRINKNKWRVTNAGTW